MDLLQRANKKEGNENIFEKLLVTVPYLNTWNPGFDP